MWTDTDVPNRDRVESSRWGVAPSIGFGTGTSTRATVSYFKLKQDNLPGVRPAVGAGQHQSRTRRRTRTARRRSIRRNFYGLVGRDYEKTDTDLATVDVAHDFGRDHRGPQPDALGPERPRLGDHRAALRGGQHQHGDQPPAAVARHDRRDPRQPDQPDVPRSTTGAIGHAVDGRRGVLVARARSTTRASVRRRRRPISITRIPIDPYPGPIVRSGASTDGDALSAAAYAFDTVTIGTHLELTGGAALGSLRRGLHLDRGRRRARRRSSAPTR